MRRAIFGLALVAACGGTTETGTPMNGGGGNNQQPPQVPANAEATFSLMDVNATSPTFGQAVSPRDYLEKISGWYFGHAT